MVSNQCPMRRTASIVFLALLGLGACSNVPTDQSSDTRFAGPSAREGRQSFRVALDGSFVLDYNLEVKYSTLDGKSCYTFISGNLTNNSKQTLSRQSVLDFIVIHNGRMLFRDITNPVADIPPGSRAMFTMVDSPVHNKHCPAYDRIDVSLRKVFLD